MDFKCYKHIYFIVMQMKKKIVFIIANELYGCKLNSEDWTTSDINGQQTLSLDRWNGGAVVRNKV